MPSRKQAASPAVDADKPGSSGDDHSRVVYIGHLPHGFYEKELLGFFSQFGKLSRVRLSRNKKTGKAKHYAFLEFQFPEVARIAAEAMDGYFLFKQRIVCRLLKSDSVHPELFKGANRRFAVKPWREIERRRHDRERTPAEHARRVAALLRKDAARAKAIREAGIDYEYEPLAAKVPSQAKKTVFE